jgi:hypothetical protein
MPVVKKNCPRCGELRFVGPWKNHPEFTELCSSCKLAVTFTSARQKAFAARVRGESSTLGLGVEVKFDLSEDKS